MAELEKEGVVNMLIMQMEAHAKRSIPKYEAKYERRGRRMEGGQKGVALSTFSNITLVGLHQ